MDDATRKQLELGKRYVEVMKQRQYQPLTVSEIAASFFAVENGYLDDVAVDRIVNFQEELLAFMRSDYADFMSSINDGSRYDEEIQKTFAEAVTAFKKTWAG